MRTGDSQGKPVPSRGRAMMCTTAGNLSPGHFLSTLVLLRPQVWVTWKKFLQPCRTAIPPLWLQLHTLLLWSSPRGSPWGASATFLLAICV